VNAKRTEDVARLVLDGAELRDALEPILRASARSAASEVTVRFADGMLIVDAVGVSGSVPASGVWDGFCTTDKSALHLLASAPKGELSISVTPDGRLVVGSASVSGRWGRGSAPQVELSLEPPLRDVLRLRMTHSDEELLATGLLQRVQQAERQRDRLVREAAARLSSLGEFQDRIAEIVSAAISTDATPPVRSEITREQATAIAEREVAARNLGVGVRGVFLVSEIRGAPPALYGGPDLAECWIAYVDRGPPEGLHSATVVLVCRFTGKVLFVGSAGDEG
jgi:hypothetical protein